MGAGNRECTRLHTTSVVQEGRKSMRTKSSLNPSFEKGGTLVRITHEANNRITQENW